MNELVVVGVFALLLVLLMFLINWQRKIHEMRDQRVVAEIRDAEDRGSSEPLAQHPQIDARACIGCAACVIACPEEGVLGMVDGVARVIHGRRCIGHGLCAEACPVGALEVGLGNVESRTDIPVLSRGLETTVPGVHIVGELGGMALIRVAADQGVCVVDEIATSLAHEDRSEPEKKLVDVLIVGAGPAGFAATLQAIKLGLSYATIDPEDLGGTVRKYPRRKLTIVGKLVLPLHGRVRKRQFRKEQLIRFWEKIVVKHGVRIHHGVRLLGLEGQAGNFIARTTGGQVRARRVILALGRRGVPRKLGVPGEELEKVLYQLVDAATYKRQHILVVGGGDSAIEAAAGLAAQRKNTVTISYRRAGFFRLKSRNEKQIERLARKGKVQLIFESEVVRISTDQVTLSVRDDGVAREVTLPNDFVFVLAGGDPPYPFLRGMGIRFNGDDAEPVGSRKSEPLTV